MSFRTRLSLIVGTMTMAAIVLLSLLSAILIEPASERTHGKLLQGIAHQLTREMQNVFLERYQDITTIAGLDVLRHHRADPARLRTILEQLKASHPVYAWIGIFDQKGTVLVATDRWLEGKSLPQRSDFVGALNGPHVADVHDGDASEPPLPDGASKRILDISAPIRNDSGQTIGVLSAHLTWEWVNELQADIAHRFNLEGLEILVANQAGEVISVQPPKPRHHVKLNDPEPIDLAVKKGEGFMMARSRWGHEYLTGYAKLEGGDAIANLKWVVLARRSASEALAIPRKNSEMILLAGTVGAILFTLLTWLLIGRFTKPILSIAQAALDAKTKGFQDTKLPTYDRQDEIGVLSSSLNDLIRDLQSVNQQLLERQDELRASEQNLMRAKRVAEEASRFKTQFLANMSHEIRTPLGAIIGFADLLRSETPSARDVREYLEVIDRNSKLLLRLIDDILDLTKVEAGKMAIENVDLSLAELVGDLQQLLALRAREKGILLHFGAETDLPARIVSDPVRLRQVLANVVGNAIKFTAQGRIDVSVSFREGTLGFRVTDTGTGISPEQAARLFQPFAQADASTTRRFGGTGLGLVLSKHLCEAMGGDFKLERSEIGRGSTFAATMRILVPAGTPYLPRAEVRFGQASSGVLGSDKGRLEGLRVLLVEDAPDNQVLLKSMLGRAGAKVDVESDGKRGFEAALRAPHDVILMDIQMPVMDGHEATRSLRARGYAGPIVALTAHAMQSERERCIASGFTDFLSKPIERRLLIDLLAEIRPRGESGITAPPP